jgi:hypothetical protein
MFIRVVSRVTVALWIAAYLGWFALRPSLDEPSLQQAARIHAVSEESPAPEPLPPPITETESRPPSPEEDVTEAAAPPQALRVGAADISEGDRFLEPGGDFPALSVSYEEFGSFGDYAHAMVRLGSRFVVVRHREIVAGVELKTGTFGEVGSVEGFSPRARDYTAEPALGAVARSARELYGSGAVVMMLVPRAFDAGLFGSIARALAERGDTHEAYREFRGRYARARQGGVHLRIERAVRRDGRPVPMDVVLDLSAVGPQASVKAAPA